MERLRHLDGLPSILCFTHDHDPGLGVEHHTKTLTQNGMIVCK
jgi:hypothetical protein